jgi:phage-related protein/predicted XRE-type DNA-binding protein
MRRYLAVGEKPLHWIGSSYRDLLRFPESVRRSIGFALGAAQYGGKHPSAKPWKGEGPGVLEVVKDFAGDTYRAVYTVRFARAISLFRRSRPVGSLPADQMSSWCAAGCARPRRTMRKGMAKATDERVITGSGNVFADLKLPDAPELDTKLRLGATICNIVKRRHLSQADVAGLLGINQPKVSALLHFKLEGFSVERLIRFLVALDRDVEIVIKHKPRNRRARIAVNAA